MKKQKILVWLRNDLRLHDHEALHRALQNAPSVAMIYCVDPRLFGKTRLGYPKTSAIRAQFLLESLADLRRSLQRCGSDLIVRHGRPETVLPELVQAHGYEAVYAHKEVTFEETRVESAVKDALTAAGGSLSFFSGTTLYHPEDLPFLIKSIPDVFTQFRKATERGARVRKVFPTPDVVPPLPEGLAPGEIPTLNDLRLEAVSPDPRGVLAFEGGETAGKARLANYFWDKDALKVYKETRNGLLGSDYSSKFSAWLALGCLSPRYVYAEVERYEKLRFKNQSTYWLIFELIWRDYFRFVAKKFGHDMFLIGGIRRDDLNLRDDERLFERWVAGTTGIPFIDANMREIAATGFMSNRGRQNVASFLVKDLKVNWTWGAEYFESQLVDYDPCSNWLNWNYVAGVGNDPRDDRYFNISKQAQTHDPKGEYVKHWLPELRGLPPHQVHAPYELSNRQLDAFDVSLGSDYPHPVVKLPAWRSR